MGIDGRRVWCFWVKKKAAMPSIRLGSPQPSWATKPPPAQADSWKGLGGRRVVVVVEAEAEAKGTLQWALSHSLQDDDTLVLVAVVKPPSRNIDRSHQKKRNSRYQMLYALQSICQTRRPEIKVEVLVVEGREQGPAIVEAARKQMASLLVLAQKKRSLAWSCIAASWSNSGSSDGIIRPSGGDGLVDYCIQNASCMTLAVRRKSKRGGYLLTTKHHKDFWLLA
ncbi:uncharacterized protein LOC122055115 [Zingiber officinale]|uniref:UspA domain-containing protein n=1 Tax=Zingiber officinale TaxID=94328 RepID=A0A8J5HLM6_ZINOF|nr:uncharacterized protein LOC122055115 [Zingiber officinale]KAG6519096.1 hypothetical protein ZIOFF_022585 [Zingiber officinale]